MTLLVDLGNTALKWASQEDPESPHTIVHGGRESFSEKLQASIPQSRFVKAVGCSVATYDLKAVTSRALDLLGCPIQWLSAQDRFIGEFELLNRYKNPQQLGSDRWHAAIGAISFLPNTPLLVVHVGTATTVDCVIPEGDNRMVFAGGRIAPGVLLMRDSLVNGTASLPKADGEYSTIPTDTMTAIVTGIIDAQLGLIERGMKSMTQLGFDPVLVLAGGAASRFAPYLKREFPEMIQKHNLVLRGLALRAQDEGE